MNKWYSDKMKEHHYSSKTDRYMVYHWYYTGAAKDWSPRSFRWGGVGVCPYSTLDQVRLRYEIEAWEVEEGFRQKERFMLKMINRFAYKNQLGLQLVAQDLSRSCALDMENFLRPEGYNNKHDQRIWNTVAGG